MPNTPSHLAFLDVPGEMAALMRQKDWSQTPFGPLETWSTALRSAVSICLGSRFPIVLYWGETRALIYNDAWSPVPGRKHPWALGRPGWEVWAEIWDIIGPMFDHVMQTGEATWSEDQLLPLNRFGYVEECYFYYSYSPVRGDRGEVEGIFTAVTETTYRVLAERRERLLRSVSEATSATRAAADACREGVQRLHGVPEESPFCLAYLRDPATGTLQRVAVAGLAADDELAPAEISAAQASPWDFAAARTSPALVSGLNERHAGRLAGLPWPEPVEEALVVPIPGPLGEEPYGYLISGLSPRRRVDADYENLFIRAAGHLSTAIANAKRYEEERRRAEQLAELDRAKTAFFSNASHEFRTPLTLMLGPLEDLLARPDDRSGRPAVSRHELELIQRNGQRLLRLVNSLLDFSRMEAGRMRARFAPLDLAVYTAELASSFRSAMARAGLAFEISCASLDEPVWVDRELWEKIVLNLISNAFKYTLEGQVKVTLQRQDGRAVLSVIDSGVGIPESELGKVFERFHRIEGQIGRTHEGTGIGLALVKDLTELHGGEVRVSSQIGVGTTFAVLLPFGHAHLPEANRAPSHPQVSTATRADTFVAEALRWLPEEQSDAPPAPLLGDVPGSGQGHGERIVLADDNADMRAYVERLLREAGYEVAAVADGSAAVAAVQAQVPELVLSDVMMPVLDGFGVIRALRNDERTSEVPIILLSARAGEEASIEGIAAGADDYLVKPFSARELIARVEGAMRLARLRRETAKALRQANEVLEIRVRERTRERDQLWAYSHDLIGIADDQGVWISINPAWTRTLGWRVDEIIGRSSQWLEHPEDQQRTRAEIARLATGAPTFNFENRFRTRAGGYRTLSWTAAPEGGLLYCVARDVTVERERALELEQAKDALRQSQKMEAIGQLTGGIAHDFNNLLTGITGSLELLQRHLAGERPRADRYIGIAIASAQRAAALTQRLLSFGRRQALDLQPLDVNRLVTGMEYLIQRTLNENIQLQLQLQADVWPTCSDANQLENALLNLCINARDAMVQAGQLEVTTRNRRDPPLLMLAEQLSGDFVELAVTDTGSGIPADVLDKVFEPFFTTKPQGKGTGLGLSMVYGFVKQSGGYIDIHSAEGRGTRVSLLLPRHLGLASEAVAESVQLQQGRGERVLVVEDEPGVRLLIVEVLRDLGYTALEAEDAPTALALLEREPQLDLVVSDVGLPGVTGRELVEEIRRQRPGIAVLLVTGYAEEAMDVQRFLGRDMQLLQKPFTIEVLSERIEQLLLARRTQP
ncbi:ATP-binding protein [Pseudomonas rhizoryzae]|uniref:ATP-binding response regulator n=1 Tax=Pseudomonas rhizoryzae TaxID=2571129 RepID=UPI0007362AD8|nr:ATP-binding protein [Pseudomonas rhizoryzae]KTT36481.1 chemotaxis protein CheY [Pseudomonas psychrotolerans]KTT78316.1 chemotaxis protein CheY [Pseudomonas psychrotolerans]